MANSYNISIDQGSTLNLSLTATDYNGNYLNFSGFNARGKVKLAYGYTGYILDLNPQVDPSYVSGLINISVPATGTLNLPVTLAVYDIEVYNASGYTFKVLQGYANINPEVTLS
jgi:hypothetical protein